MTLTTNNTRRKKMTIQEQIEKEIKASVRKKSVAPVFVDNLKFVKSELQRIGKVVSDEDAVKVIRKFIKNESSLPEPHTVSIKFFEQFVPAAGMSEEDITAWIHQNIDFSTVPNKMAAMGPIMAGLKDKGVSGAVVKSILEKM